MEETFHESLEDHVFTFCGAALRLLPDASIPTLVLLRHNQFRWYTEEDIEICVRENAKQRFKLLREKGGCRVRCYQGHTPQERKRPLHACEHTGEHYMATFAAAPPQLERDGGT